MWTKILASVLAAWVLLCAAPLHARLNKDKQAKLDETKRTASKEMSKAIQELAKEGKTREAEALLYGLWAQNWQDQIDAVKQFNKDKNEDAYVAALKELQNEIWKPARNAVYPEVPEMKKDDEGARLGELLAAAQELYDVGNRMECITVCNHINGRIGAGAAHDEKVKTAAAELKQKALTELQDQYDTTLEAVRKAIEAAGIERYSSGGYDPDTGVEALLEKLVETEEYLQRDNPYDGHVKDFEARLEDLVKRCDAGFKGLQEFVDVVAEPEYLRILALQTEQLQNDRKQSAEDRQKFKQDWNDIWMFIRQARAVVLAGAILDAYGMRATLGSAFLKLGAWQLQQAEGRLKLADSYKKSDAKGIGDRLEEAEEAVAQAEAWQEFADKWPAPEADAKAFQDRLDAVRERISNWRSELIESTRVPKENYTGTDAEELKKNLLEHARKAGHENVLRISIRSEGWEEKKEWQYSGGVWTFYHWRELNTYIVVPDENDATRCKILFARFEEKPDGNGGWTNRRLSWTYLYAPILKENVDK